MGHKVNPYGFRLGVIYPWKSKWYAGATTRSGCTRTSGSASTSSRLSRAGISAIDIERKGDQIQVFIRTARPGIVIGRKGAEVDRIRKDVEKITGKRVDVKVEDMNQSACEIRPETDAALLAQGVAEQLVGRVSFREPCAGPCRPRCGRAPSASGSQCAGRLGGAEMSAAEWYREGRVPLHTLRAKIDYGRAEAKTTFGVIGVKVWVYHGDEIPTQEQETARHRRATARASGPRSDSRGATAAPTPAPAAGRPQRPQPLRPKRHRHPDTGPRHGPRAGHGGW